MPDCSGLSPTETVKRASRITSQVARHGRQWFDLVRPISYLAAMSREVLASQLIWNCLTAKESKCANEREVRGIVMRGATGSTRTGRCWARVLTSRCHCPCERQVGLLKSLSFPTHRPTLRGRSRLLDQKIPVRRVPALRVQHQRVGNVETRVGPEEGNASARVEWSGCRRGASRSRATAGTRRSGRASREIVSASR